MQIFNILIPATKQYGVTTRSCFIPNYLVNTARPYSALRKSEESYGRSLINLKPDLDSCTAGPILSLSSDILFQQHSRVPQRGTVPGGVGPGEDLNLAPPLTTLNIALSSP